MTIRRSPPNVVPGNKPRKKEAWPMNATESLIEANDAWIAAINSGDHATGLAAMSDDAVVVSPDGSTAVGREQFSRQIAELTRVPGFTIGFQLTSVSASNDGKSGVVVGRSTLTFTGPDGALTTTEQPLLTVWQQDENQSWRCYVDAVMAPSTN